MATRPNPHDSLAEQGLFARAQAGDPRAWDELFHECYPKVRRYIRRRIDSRLRRYVDSTDIANEVFGDFSLKVEEFHFDSVDAVRRFLAKAARDRIIDEYRRHQTRKRDSGLERPLDHAAGGGESAWDLSSGEPTPSQHAIAHEVDARLRAATDDDDGRRIIELRGQHYNNEEVSEQVGWTKRRVQRFLEKLRPIFLN